MPFDMVDIMRWNDFQAIQEFYGDGVAARSHVPLINHIIEGVAYLNDHLKADELTIRAYCLHPIAQAGYKLPSGTHFFVKHLAEEYTDRANSYLCKPETDHIRFPAQLMEVVENMTDQCRQMLIADKVQNCKDFFIHHYGKHERSDALADYFHIWLDYLNGPFIKIAPWFGAKAGVINGR